MTTTLSGLGFCLRGAFLWQFALVLLSTNILQCHEKFQQMATCNIRWRLITLLYRSHNMEDYWIEPEPLTDEYFEELDEARQRLEDASLENN